MQYLPSLLRDSLSRLGRVYDFPLHGSLPKGEMQYLPSLLRDSLSRLGRDCAEHRFTRSKS